MSVPTTPGNMAGEAVLQVAGSIKIAPDHHAVAIAIRSLAAHAARQGGSPEEIAARIEAIAIEAPAEPHAALGQGIAERIAAHSNVIAIEDAS